MAPSRLLDSRTRSSLLILLFLSVAINYMDRGSLGVAAPVMMLELRIEPERMGLLLSAFFWTYASFQIVSGWLVDRFDVKYVYAGGFLVWSAAMLSTGLVTGFAALLATRLVLGAGESVAYPAYSRILSTGFPEHRRGFANALIDFGTKIAPAIGTLLGMTLPYLGWRMFFVAIGGASLVWLLPWMMFAPRVAARAKHETAAPTFADILTRRAPWATCFGLMGFNYAIFLFLTWLPTYLVNERKLTLKEMSIYGAIPFCVTAVSAITWGWLSDRWIGAGAAVNRIRRPIAVAGLLIAAGALPFGTANSHVVAMAGLIVGFGGMGMYTSQCWAITQSMAGEAAAGKWTGLQNAVGNLGGILAPMVTGFIVQNTGSFRLAFFAASGMLAMGACMYAFVIGPVLPVTWRERAEARVS